MKGVTFLRTILNFFGRLTTLSLTVLSLLAVSVIQSDAFSIEPIGTKRGDTIMYFKVPALFRIWYPTASRIATDLFTNPVHERATNIIYGCDDARENCADNGGSNPYAPAAVNAGNQWNDNPPFQLTSTRSFCKKYVGTTIKSPYFGEYWYMLLRDGEKRKH